MPSRADTVETLKKFYSLTTMEDLPNNTLLCLLHEREIPHDLSSFPLTWSLDDRKVAIEKISSLAANKDALNVDTVLKPCSEVISLPNCYDLFKQKFPLHKISKKSLNNWSVNDYEQAQIMLK